MKHLLTTIALVLLAQLPLHAQGSIYTPGAVLTLVNTFPDPSTCLDGNIIILTAPQGGFIKGTIHICLDHIWYPIPPTSLINGYLDFLGTANVPAPTAGTQRLYAQTIAGVTKFASRGAGNNVLVFHEDVVTAASNLTGVAIPRGTVVMVTGYVGPSDAVTVQPATAIAAQDRPIAFVNAALGLGIGSVGIVQTVGKVYNLDTSMFTQGDRLWLSPTTPGALTNLEPAVPLPALTVGRVLVSSPTVGSILLDLQRPAPQQASTLQKTVTGMANNVFTDVLTLTIPNVACAAIIEVTLTGSLGAGGAIGPYESTTGRTVLLTVTRTPNLSAVVDVSTPTNAMDVRVAGGATINQATQMSAVSGLATAIQTASLQYRLTRGSGASTNHVTVLAARVVGTGITLQ